MNTHIEEICLGINYISGTQDLQTTHHVFTDGSCTKNGKKDAKAGYSVVFVLGPWKNKLILKSLNKGSKYPDSNIRAEGFAILCVLQKLKKNNKWVNCFIYTDSEFWKKMIEEYMPKWSDNDFCIKKNPDLTKKIWKLWNHISSDKKTIKIVFVRAHNKNGWKDSIEPYKKFCYDNNKVADSLANIARDEF